jgi:hypothetical protein
MGSLLDGKLGSEWERLGAFAWRRRKRQGARAACKWGRKSSRETERQRLQSSKGSRCCCFRIERWTNGPVQKESSEFSAQILAWRRFPPCDRSHLYYVAIKLRLDSRRAAHARRMPLTVPDFSFRLLSAPRRLPLEYDYPSDPSDRIRVA